MSAVLHAVDHQICQQCIGLSAFRALCVRVCVCARVCVCVCVCSSWLEVCVESLQDLCLTAAEVHEGLPWPKPGKQRSGEFAGCSALPITQTRSLCRT